jgi:hypothetical protein
MSTVVDLANRTQKTRRMTLPRIVISFAAFVIFLALFAPSLFLHLRLHAAQYTDTYYAFYLESGNVFYGQVRGVGFGQIILSNAYSFQEVEVGETTTSNLSALAQNPLTRPENWLALSRDHILFYERIGKDASVLEALRAQ